jgi:hypothetical protein
MLSASLVSLVPSTVFHIPRQTMNLLSTATTLAWARVATLTVMAVQPGCSGLGDLAESYVESNIIPSQVATFAELDSADCRFPPRLETGAIAPAPVLGMGAAGIGYAGQYEVRALRNVYLMQPVLEFDLSAIPPASGNPSLAATLTFTEEKTDRTVSSGTCRDDIVDSIEVVAADWGPRSDFTTIPASRRFTTVPCDRTPGGRGTTTLSCNVSVAVQDWLSRPADRPNNGFMIGSVHRTFDNCSIEIGEPGTHLDCAASIRYVVLNVRYLPPES